MSNIVSKSVGIFSSSERCQISGKNFFSVQFCSFSLLRIFSEVVDLFFILMIKMITSSSVRKSTKENFAWFEYRMNHSTLKQLLRSLLFTRNKTLALVVSLFAENILNISKQKRTTELLVVVVDCLIIDLITISNWRNDCKQILQFQLLKFSDNLIYSDLRCDLRKNSTKYEKNRRL